MTTIRKAAVAGIFYPADPTELERQLDELLNKAGDQHEPALALIVPHAGYIYSGAIAASAYTHLTSLRGKIRNVVLLGPSHRVAFKGIAMSSADKFVTPLGEIPLNHEAQKALLKLPQVQPLDQAHAKEHCLEVQLPFLQKVLGDFSLIPLVVGNADADEVAEAIDALWNDEETLIVVSTDLSHYHDYHTAQQLDRFTCAAIEALEPEAIGHDQACGKNPLAGLLTIAKQRNLHIHTLDLRNSGDTAGIKDQVVGYGAWMLTN